MAAEAPVRNEPALETCALCGGQLCYTDRHEPRPDGSRKVLPGRQVACSVCQHPVPPDHPAQADLDERWAVSDLAERRAEAARKPSPSTEYVQAQPLAEANDRLVQVARLVEAQARQLADQARRLAALEAALLARQDHGRRKG